MIITLSMLRCNICSDKALQSSSDCEDFGQAFYMLRLDLGQAFYACNISCKQSLAWPAFLCCEEAALVFVPARELNSSTPQQGP